MLLLTAPEGISKPTLVSHTPTSVLITWSPPTEPNGELLKYTIIRRDEETNTTKTIVEVDPRLKVLEYVDDSVDIVPFHVYSYRILARNSAGTGYGPWASVVTRSSSMFSDYKVIIIYVVYFSIDLRAMLAWKI